MRLLETFSVLNAMIAFVIALITAIVGWSQVKRLTRERYTQTIDDYDRLNRVKDENFEFLKAKSDKQDDQIFVLNHRLGELGAHNKDLLRTNFEQEAYIRTMLVVLKRARIPAPARPDYSESGKE